MPGRPGRGPSARLRPSREGTGCLTSLSRVEANASAPARPPWTSGGVADGVDGPCDSRASDARGVATPSPSPPAPISSNRWSESDGKIRSASLTAAAAIEIDAPAFQDMLKRHLGLELPPTAIGKDYISNGSVLARTPSGSGLQLSLLGRSNRVLSRDRLLERCVRFAGLVKQKQVTLDLGLGKVRLLTNRPRKIAGLEQSGGN